MKRTTKIMITAAVLGGLGAVGVAGASVAEEGWFGHHRGGYHDDQHGVCHHGGPSGGQHPGGRHLAMFESFDSDNDGKLTQAEIDQGRARRFSTFDKDGDQQLTLQEFEALWLDAMRERLVDRFQDLDNDGDAVVTLEEFQMPFARVVAGMDRNGDAALSPDDHGFRGRGHHDEDDDDRD